VSFRSITKLLTENEDNPWNKRGLIRTHIGGFLFLYRAIDLLFILVCLKLSLILDNSHANLSILSNGLIAILIFLYLAESLELYCSWRTMKSTEMLCTLWLTCALSASGYLIAVRLLNMGTIAPDIHLLWVSLVLLTLTGWRLIYRKFFHWIRSKGYNSRSAVIIGLTESGLNLAANIAINPQLGIKNVGFFDDREIKRLPTEHQTRICGSIGEAINLARNNAVDIIYIAMPLRAQERITSILKRCGDSTVPVHVIPDCFEYNMLHTCFHTVGSIATLSVYESALYGARTWIKRAEDILLALFILVLVSIPMILIATTVKLSSPGPIIFKQNRYGMCGRKIEVWKFRTMTTLENGDDIPQATKNDSRVTKVGKFLRRTSLDELPQFFNVLQGTMSVVGPRPHAVCHNEQYRALIDCYMLRHKVKPGITGWAQINGFRGETNTLEKMKKRVDYDLEYIRSWSVFLDLKIVLLTILTGFTDSNAY